MKAYAASLLVLAWVAATAQAHFIWIVPRGDSSSAQVVFSDTLQPDDADLLGNIAASELFVRNPDGKTAAIKWSREKDAYLLAPEGKGPRTLGAVCRYGVIQRGKSEPFLLHYYAKLSPPQGGDVVEKAWDRLPLEVLSLGGAHFQVLWLGKPLPDAEVVVLLPGGDRKEDHKTNGKGQFSVRFEKNGNFGIRVRHVEARAGKHEGKDYKEVRHYSTLVGAVVLGAGKEADQAGDRKEEPAASKLLQEARAARANWQKFPGFSAAISVNLDGKVSKGQVRVEATGKLALEGLDKAAEAWVKRTLGSAVSHRMDGSATRNTPCAFADADETHPLGRKILVLNDELHSSYRIRDKQIMVVYRAMGDSRFTITMQENRTNPEGKFLPISYMVSTWNQTGALQSEAHFQSWKRLGTFDLPETIRVVAATPQGGPVKASSPVPGPKDGLETRSLTLSNHKLLEAAAPK